MFILLCSSVLFIVVIDVPFQIWNHNKQLKMTKQEVKDEYKDTEGKPEVKGRVRQMQRELAQRRMMAEVPNADVIVVNRQAAELAAPERDSAYRLIEARRRRRFMELPRPTPAVVTDAGTDGTYQCMPANKAALPPAAVVFTVTVCSAQNRYK